MPDAGTVTVTGPKGEPWTFAVSFSVTEFDPTTPEGRDRMGRIEQALIGDRSAALSAFRASRAARRTSAP